MCGTGAFQWWETCTAGIPHGCMPIARAILANPSVSTALFDIGNGLRQTTARGRPLLYSLLKHKRRE